MLSSEDFYSMPVFLFKCIGSNIPPFGKQNPNKLKQIFLDIVHILLFVYMMLYICYILAYILKSIESEKYLFALIGGSSFCGTISCVLKKLAMSLKLPEMRKIKKALKSIFPKTQKDQILYKAKKYQQKVHKFCFYYSLVTMGSCTCWCLRPVFIGLLKFVLYKSSYERDLIFYAYYFYDTRSNIFIYIFTYIMEIITGYFSSILTFGIDMFICSVIKQLCMYLDFISKSLEEYNPKHFVTDQRSFLKLLNLHRRCLQ